MTYTDLLIAALDELDNTNALIDWCEGYLATAALEALAIDLSGNL